jgi:hypothetical protein
MVGVLAPQQGLFAPRALPRFSATAGPSVTLSPSTDFPALPVIRFPCSADFSTDEEGFSSCSRHPCHRAVANAPPEHLAASVSCDDLFCLHPPIVGSASGSRILEDTYAFIFITAR